jgi:hypothetical protein
MFLSFQELFGALYQSLRFNTVGANLLQKKKNCTKCIMILSLFFAVVKTFSKKNRSIPPISFIKTVCEPIAQRGEGTLKHAE